MRYSRLQNGKIVFSSTLWRTEDDLHKFNVTKEADTIEELCDEFVYVDSQSEIKHNCFYTFENALAMYEKLNIDKTTIKGAIWTDKGLIFVAKMNDKGELELL